MSTSNLKELSEKVAKANIQRTDEMMAAYLEQTIRHITERGDKIENYALVLVNNPMEITETGLKVTSQYRIVPVAELKQLESKETKDE